MPYKVQRRGKKFVVVNAKSGKVMGTHPSSSRANRQVRALYANEVVGQKDVKANNNKIGKTAAGQIGGG